MKPVDGEEHMAEIGVLKDPGRIKLSAPLGQGIATLNEAVRAGGIPLWGSEKIHRS